MAPALTNEEKENRRLRVQQNVLYRQSLLEQADRIECERGAMRRRERTLRHHDQLRREEREARSLEVQEQGDSRSGHTSHRHLSRRSAAAMRGGGSGGGVGGGGGGIDLHRVVSTVADGALDMRLMSRNAAVHQELLAVDVMRRIRAADKQSRGRVSRRHPTLASNATRTSTDRADTTTSMTSSPPPPPPPTTQRRLRTERVARRSRPRTSTTSGVASRTRQASARDRLSANGHQASHRATVARPRAPSPTTKYFGGTVHSRTRARTRRRGRRSCSKQSTNEAWKRQKSKSTTSKNSDRSKGPR